MNKEEIIAWLLSLVLMSVIGFYMLTYVREGRPHPQTTWKITAGGKEYITKDYSVPSQFSPVWIVVDHHTGKTVYLSGDVTLEEYDGE